MAFALFNAELLFKTVSLNFIDTRLFSILFYAT